MNPCFVRGLAACSMGVVLLACSDDDGRRDPAPSTPATSSHAPAAPSTPPPAATATGGTSTSTNGGSSGADGASSSGASVASGNVACAPNAVCGGISNCQDTHYTCPSGQTGQMYCDCDGSATDPSSHLSCVIYC